MYIRGHSGSGCRKLLSDSDNDIISWGSEIRFTTHKVPGMFVCSMAQAHLKVDPWEDQCIDHTWIQSDSYIQVAALAPLALLLVLEACCASIILCCGVVHHCFYTAHVLTCE